MGSPSLLLSSFGIDRVAESPSLLSILLKVLGMALLLWLGATAKYSQIPGYASPLMSRALDHHHLGFESP